MYIKVICPYCGQEIKVLIDLQPCISPRIIYHDQDEFHEGCGKYFVLQAEVNVNAKTLKIEGEDNIYT